MNESEFSKHKKTSTVAASPLVPPKLSWAMQVQLRDDNLDLASICKTGQAFQAFQSIPEWLEHCGTPPFFTDAQTMPVIYLRCSLSCRYFLIQMEYELN